MKSLCNVERDLLDLAYAVSKHFELASRLHECSSLGTKSEAFQQVNEELRC